MYPDGTQEIRDLQGQVVGYFVPAPVFTQMQQERQELRERNDRLHRQVEALIPVGTPEEEAEILAQIERAVPLDIEGLIREIETDGRA